MPLIAITSRADSALGKQSDVVLELPKAKEACPHGLAPTTSTTMQLAIGDCLAVALLEAKGFTAHDFKVFHPGGSLGASLKYVADVMHKGERLPLAAEDEPMGAALLTMTAKSFGCLGVVDKKGKLVGIVTDGDLRRHMGDDLLRSTAGDIMTKEPEDGDARHARRRGAGDHQRQPHHGAVRGRQGQAGRHRARPRSAAGPAWRNEAKRGCGSGPSGLRRPVHAYRKARAWVNGEDLRCGSGCRSRSPLLLLLQPQLLRLHKW